MFEVEHFRYAILATVSRCGMIWFSEGVIEPSVVYRHYLNTPATVPLDADDENAADTPGCRTGTLAADASDSANIATQVQIASILERYFAGGDLVSSALTFAESIDHIVDFTSARALHTLFSLLNKMARNVIEYNLQHSDFPLAPERVEQYVTKRLLVSIILAFSGGVKLDLQAEMGDFLRKQTGIDLPPLVTGFLGSPKCPPLRSMHILSRLQTLLYLRWTLFATKKCCTLGCQSTSPLMLCGPPGSGKTVTLFSALRKLPDMDVVGLNFSSATTPELILKTFGFSMKKNWTCRLLSSTMFSTTSFELIEYSARCGDIYFLLESAEVARQVPLSLERFCFLTFVQITLSRFVAWLNRLSIFQIKVSNKYTGDDFDDDLRIV
jgi:dynein heavy chain 1